MSSQRDAQGLARVAGPRACIAKTSNVKNPWIHLEGEAYKERVTAFELDCNICGKRLGWSSSHATPPASSQGQI